ncbi:hypothetical protein VKT23_002546 [Stygiomarasmius scandens]
METLLIFSALYSASLTAFIIESYKTLQDDPAQNTVELLIQISQQLDGMTGFNTTSSFEPPASAVVCNMMWFLALALALACSLLATFVQQWTRDFIHKTTLRPSPIRRARIIAFLYFGLHEFGMPTLVDIIPVLLHISLFLFFGGLVGFLFPVSKPLTYVMAAVLAIFFIIYLVLTLLPLFFLDSPYRTPLSGLLWRFGKAPGNFLVPTYQQQQTLTDAVLEHSVQENTKREERDKKAMAHTIRSLTDDTQLLPFIEAIPDALHDPFRRNQVRSANVALLLPLILSAEPEINVILRIAQFASKSGSWTGEFRKRSSLACSQALSTIACVSLELPASEYSNHHISVHSQWRRTVISSLEVNDSSLGNDVWSALAAISVGCLYSIIENSLKSFPTLNGVTAMKTYKSLFEEVSAYADILLRMPFSDLSCLDALLRIFQRGQPSRNIPFEEIKNKLAGLKGNQTWHFIRLYILHDYLVRSQRLERVPADFEDICNIIYPSFKNPLSISQSNQNLSHHLNTSSSLLALQANTKETGPDDNTDMLLKRNLKLFLSTSVPLCSDEETWECRNFVLSYLYERYKTCPPDYAWKHFDVHDLDRIRKCTLEHIQDPPADVQQSDICFKVALMLMCTFDLRWLRKSDFFPNLFHVPSISNDQPLGATSHMSDAALNRIIFIKMLQVRNTTAKRIVTEQAKSIISMNGEQVRHLIQVGILHRYLLESSPNKPYPNFELMCNAIYPHSKPCFEITGGGDLSRLLRTSDQLLALKKHVNGRAEGLNDSTDALLRQYLKLFLSTSINLCSQDEARECRGFVLWYFHRRHKDCTSFNVWRKFWAEDLERIGQCILEHMQDLPNDVEQSEMCLRVALILMCTGHFRWLLYKDDFFSKLFHFLRENPQEIAFKRNEGYLSFKTLLDLVLCVRSPLIPYADPLVQESMERARTNLVSSYLPPDLPRSGHDTKLHRDNLIVTVISRYINLFLETGMPSYAVGILEELHLWDWISESIHEEIQIAFAESVARLIRKMSGTVLENESADLELTLLNVMAAPHLPTVPGAETRLSTQWQWMNSRRSAKILFGALSQYKEPGNDRILDVDGRFRYLGKYGRERLFEHCQDLVLEVWAI